MLPRKPPHTFMATLIDANTILHEDGKTYKIENVPKQTRIWSHWENTVKHIWEKEKTGEVLVYDQTPVRWRKESKYEDHSWPSVGNNQDVYLMKNEMFPQDKESALISLIEWRDWIEEYGANAFGTVASISWSIWRSTFKEDFYSPTEWPKAIKFPIGGRLVPCKEINSAWIGTFNQWDLQAAYAKELSSIRYGGRGSKWIEVKSTSNYQSAVEKGLPVYIRARVWIPRMKFGPLPRRRLVYSPFSRVPIQYLTNGRIHGTWTFEEIQQAEKAGCSIAIEKVYVHIAGGKELHFSKWWEIIKEGREHLNGFTKSLAKSTGNSLWGQFALRERPRKIRWMNDDGKRKHRIIEGRLTNRPGSPELSDQLTGKIRAKLFEMMMLSDELLMQANTDGAWLIGNTDFRPPDGWRIKKTASIMEFIDESNYRFYNTEKEIWEYVMGGVPLSMQEDFFTADWNRICKEGKPYASTAS